VFKNYPIFNYSYKSILSIIFGFPADSFRDIKFTFPYKIN